MTTTSDQDSFRTLLAGARTLTVQTRPVSADFAMANADDTGHYMAVLALDPHFYDFAVEHSEGADELTDDLVARLVDGLSPYDASEDIVGFDYDNGLVLVRVSTDVAAAIAERDEDLAAE